MGGSDANHYATEPLGVTVQGTKEVQGTILKQFDMHQDNFGILFCLKKNVFLLFTSLQRAAFGRTCSTPLRLVSLAVLAYERMWLMPCRSVGALIAPSHNMLP